ncbi:hypothetical protein [Bdellovibrio bacteriovorus]|uniref:Uncharacterized protein n=1 Tax=Bdellovibrio bacteriovorus TaxID=959 RepID=A0A1Z3N7Y8_BDEBC|nr:hypothetical protein [Bdellovibrio bacteriovorus]ASD63590.1 hypothetical protein B9G79_08385 [Bdellovibrio bacteriovorus]
MKTLIIAVFAILISQSVFAKTIQVTGRGSEYSYCNANSGSFCFNNIKQRSEDEAERDARWTCEMTHRGRSLTYTTFTNTFCSPNYLPPRHDGTWVNCRSDARMQCEVQN